MKDYLNTFLLVLILALLAVGFVKGMSDSSDTFGAYDATNITNPWTFGDDVTFSANATFSDDVTFSTANLTNTGGQTTVGELIALEESTSLTGSTTLTNAQSNTTIYWNTTGGTTTLPAVATATGTVFRFVVASAIATYNAQISSAEGDNIEGSMIVAGAVVDCDASDRIYVLIDGENLGDFVEIRSNGQKWYVTQSNALTSGKLLCDG
jgi:hypothetical protein